MMTSQTCKFALHNNLYRRLLLLLPKQYLHVEYTGHRALSKRSHSRPYVDRGMEKSKNNQSSAKVTDSQSIEIPRTESDTAGYQEKSGIPDKSGSNKVNVKHKEAFQEFAANRFYFKQTFLKQHPVVAQSVNRISSPVVDGKITTKDERDPNERIEEALPDEAQDTPRDKRLNIPLTREGRIGKNAYYYTRKMSLMGRQGRVKEAIDIFEHWMMVRDRVMPNRRTFTVLIGILGRVGYTEKAFELYKKMRNMNLDADDQVLTGLFNACANSPSPHKALKQANGLLSYLQASGRPLNLITIKAAAKAMAFCGNFPRAFEIMDEASQRLTLDAECFNHLLLACVADKKAGFGRALMVWQKMKEFNVKPETNTYNLLVRTARDCNIGDPRLFANVLGLASAYSQLPEDVQLISSGKSLEISGPDSHNVSSDRSSEDNYIRLACGLDNGLTPDPASVCGYKISKEESDPSKPEYLKSPGCEKRNDLSTLSPARHSLYHNIPNFDQNIEEFLIQRNAQRETEDFDAKGYEWWEEQSTSEESHQLDREEHYLSEAQLQVLDETSIKDFFEEGLNFSIAEQSITSDAHENATGVHNHAMTNELEKYSSRAKSNTVKPLMVKEITKPAQRFAVLGGVRQFVRQMLAMGANPDVKTFSQMVSCLPGSEQAEIDLLTLMVEVGVKPDTDLINDLMMKRNHRHAGETVKALLPVMSRLGLVPNMRTYAALALTCLKESDAHSLIADMQCANLEPTREVCGHLIYISRTNFKYKLHMLQLMDKLSLKPVPETIRVIEKSILIVRKNIIAAEKSADSSSFYLSQEYQEDLRRFLNYYNGWLKRTPLHKAKHPWQAFKSQHKNTQHDNDVVQAAKL